MEERPNPEKLLKQINLHQKETGRGKLKIFFGYAAGVGKTYAMLDAAHAMNKAGEEVVIGYIEPHARPETLALIEGLEVIKPLEIEYRGITLKELDLDAVLIRHPKLVLVDELAHTNAEGCRHKKRYSDIEELLKAGIDVYTTVNVQHIESLNDIVASITGVIVKERIPDQVFNKADQVELVDIEPEELIKRLKDGKIYQQNKVSHAMEHFFVKENLIALREIALRRTADRVNRDVELIKEAKSGVQYITGEHILVCLSASPSNAKVIRTAARMANAFRAPLTALLVQTPSLKEMDDKAKRCLKENITLAKEFGAHIVTTFGEDIAKHIIEYAKASGISKIVVGRTNTKKSIFTRKNSLVDRLIHLAPYIDVYIIPDAPSFYKNKYKKSFMMGKEKLNYVDMIKTLLILVACILLGILFEKIGMRESNIIMVFILGVLVSAMVTKGRTYSVVASVVSVITFNFFFTNPRFSLESYDPGYPVTFLIMLIAAIMSSSMAIRVKRQAKEAASQAYRTQILLDTSRRLQRAKDISSIVEKTAEQIIKLVNKPLTLYVEDHKQLGEPKWFPCDAKINIDYQKYIDKDERAVAEWTYKNGMPAGTSTNTLPGAEALYLPIGNGKEVFAVVGIVLGDGEEIETFEYNILVAMLNEVAFAIEKYRLDRLNKEVEFEAEQEKLRANLLRSISHDLRTPLTSISGNASILLSQEGKLSEAFKRQACESIYEDSIWLINLVENLLSITRVENGTMQLRLQLELVEELLAEAIQHAKRIKRTHSIKMQCDEEILMVEVDSRLIIQVIINFLDNAIKYAEEGSTIIVSAKREKNEVAIEVADTGIGVTDEDKKRIFDMFYTAGNKEGDGRRGLGLGLALCKSIVAAHGGSIYIKDNTPKGTIFGFRLQCKEVNQSEEEHFGSGGR